MPEVADPYPPLGLQCEDATGRHLIVDEVVRGDRLGREIRGRVNGRRYTTDLPQFFAVWIERRLPKRGGAWA